MALYYAEGAPDKTFEEKEIRAALNGVFDQLGERNNIIAVPPDYTRFYSQSGMLTCMAQDYYGERLVDVIPALGTHKPMTDEQLDKMLPAVPKEKIRVHDWRNDVVTVGTVPAEVVGEITGGLYQKPWQAQMNQLIWEGGHDLILSVGQVVPHEVIGMANYNKNIFVGTGGHLGINESHWIGALYGVERTLGQPLTPLRQILNYAQDSFCAHLPLLYIQTVVGPDLELRGLYIGDDAECFVRASELAREVNINLLDEELDKVVVYLDPEEFHSTWIGNKGVYRTRMAIADAGELVILGPGVSMFGEDDEIDAMIRKYGYRTTPDVMRFVEENADLRANLGAAAHLIHASSEGRFKITWCPGGLSREEIEAVGYAYGDVDEQLKRYDPAVMQEGWNELPDGERVYFVHNPAMGLWANRSRFG